MQHTTQALSAYPKWVAIPALIFSALVALALSATPAHAVTAAEKQAEAEEALANLTAMQESLDRLEAEYGEAQAAQKEAEDRRDAAEVRIGEIGERLNTLQLRLNERARDMYRAGNVSYLEILLGSRSFEEFATSLDMVNKLNQNDADMVDEQRSLKAEAEEQAVVLDEQAAVAAQKSEEAEAAAEQAQATVAEMQSTYENLSAEAEELLEEERKAREAEEAARAAAVLAAAQAAAEEEAARQAAEEAANAQASEGSSASNDESGDGGSAEDTSSTSGDAISYEGGSDTVSRAYACLGAPYVWGAVGPNGYDCSGLVSYCLTGSHSRLGTTYTFMGWPTVSNPQPGDIAVNWSHTGVYIGNGQMIHASTYGVGVIIGPVQSGMKFVRYGG